MFYYFGRKWALSPHYPPPAGEIVIEPFAGSMAYTLYNRPNAAIGIEQDAEVHNLWHSLVSGVMGPGDLASYPEPAVGTRVDDRWQMMAAGSHGTFAARTYLWTKRMAKDFRQQKRMAANCLDYARSRIEYRLADYKSAPDLKATWFIDPPYQKVRRGYWQKPDYGELASWCRSRKGLVIVCEQEGADWLPFLPLKTIKGTNNKRTMEVVWISENV